MRSILNGEKLEDNVKNFYEKLNTKGRVTQILNNLAQLKIDSAIPPHWGLRQNDVFDYIEKIETEYRRIMIANPLEIETLKNEFEAIIQAENITSAFQKAVVKAMDYQGFRSFEFMEMFQTCNIKTCVYCHCQLTLIIKKYLYKRAVGGHAVGDVREFRGLLQLDHKNAKSKYPFICTSFYNLYPICSNCNIAKSANATAFNLYLDKPPLDFLTFGLKTASVLSYWETHDPEVLEIEIRSVDGNDTVLTAYLNMFNIKFVYDTQKDLIEELLQKQFVYNKLYKETLSKSFKDLFANPTMINRLLIGNYDQPKDILKRPMAKFIQEIARDIKFIP